MMKRMVILRQCQPPPPPPQPQPQPQHAAEVGSCCGRVKYGECRRNHAARMGGHAVDGCREFLAEGEEGTGGALRCAACGCHRSFHRRVVVQQCCGCDTAAAAAAGGWEWRDCSPQSSSSASSTTAS